MATELATVEKRETRLAHPPMEFSNEQTRILAETIAKGCDQNELGFFINVCKLKRLDPFGGQVHVVKRWDSDLGRDKMTIQVGIDGFRVIAARTGEHAGTTEPEYDSEEGQHPNWARVTVFRYGRNDEKIPYTVKARFTEFAVTKKDGNINRMWATKPYVMLAKCAEAQALRKAFPDELSGMYAEEEMGQADEGGSAPPGKPPVNMPKSTDEKKEPPKQSTPPPAQTQSAATKNEPEKLSGEIVSVTDGKNGVKVLNVNGQVVLVPGKLATDDLVKGAKLLCMTVWVKIKNQPMREVREIEMIVAPATEDVVEGEIIPPGGDPVLAEARHAGLDGLFEGEPANKPQTTMEAPTQGSGDPPTKPGTIGFKRAKRLYTLISQNHKNTGFTEEECKKIMSALPNPIEHVREIELGMYEEFEKWATGEADFKDFWKE